jgi:hypothetical protein
MKLYTEFEVKFAMDIARCQPDRTFDEVLAGLTPIEIPSDEEIAKQSKIHSFEEHSFLTHQTQNQKRLSFYNGAKWMLDKIQGGNK